MLIGIVPRVARPVSGATLSGATLERRTTRAAAAHHSHQRHTNRTQGPERAPNTQAKHTQHTQLTSTPFPFSVRGGRGTTLGLFINYYLVCLKTHQITVNPSLGAHVKPSTRPDHQRAESTYIECSATGCRLSEGRTRSQKESIRGCSTSRIRLQFMEPHLQLTPPPACP